MESMSATDHGDCYSFSKLYTNVTGRLPACACKTRACISNATKTIVNGKMARVLKQKGHLNLQALVLKALNVKSTKGSKGGRSRLHISCHHYDPMVLDKYFCPFSYIRDKELAQRLYGENAASLLVPGKGDNSWYVVPTYPTCGALEIKNRFTMNPETPTCGTLEEALNGNQVQPLNIFSTILAGPRKAVKSVCNSVRKAIGRRKRMTTTTSTRTDDSSPPNQLSKHRRIDN